MKKKLLHNAGFTLIEIMVVVVILGILALIVVPKVIDRPDQAKLVRAKQDVNSIQTALDLYRLDNGAYPTTDQGLEALVHKPTTTPIPENWHQYLHDAPLDPWKTTYHYLNPGVHNPDGVDVFTYGSTGQPGGKGEKAEIGNWGSQSSAK